MTDEEKRAQIAEGMAKVRKIFEKVQPRCERRGKRLDRQLPIRRVVTRYIFRRHEVYLERLWMFSDLGLHRNVARKTDYKNWHS